MDISVRHWIPGRIRLHAPVFAQAGSAAEKLVAWLAAQDGVESARINPGNACLIVTYDQARKAELEMLLGYMRMLSPRDVLAMAATIEPSLVPAHAPNTSRPDATVLALPTVSLALAFSGNPVAIALNLPLMLWNAWPIARRAWGVWTGEQRLNVDCLDALAITASMAQGSMVTGGMITWLIHLGDWIRDLTAMGSKKAISGLMEFEGKSAWLLRDGAVIEVLASQLQTDDLVIVYPGEMVPVDGEVVEGDALVDQKTITGESLPVVRGMGDTVFAATALREGQITIRASRVGTETIAGQIARLVDSAPVGDTRMQNHAERFADRLVLPTLGLASGTAMASGDLNRFLSLVICDYGTGIRVAAPTAVLASMTRAARNGIIIKSGAHLEKLAEVDTVVFDKTGTLTHGVPEVMAAISYQSRLDPNHLLGLAVGAESRLQHPVAEALRGRARDLGVTVPLCDAPDYKVGLGVQGQVNGHYVHIGSERFLTGSQIRVTQATADRAALDERGYSCLYMAVDGELAGLIPYADKLRPESHDVVRALHGLGVRNTVMLTGDNATVARAVGARIGVTRQFSDMMPADKAEVIASLRKDGNVVAMVGDGINDSVALAYADVGIAMRHGAEVTHESAHVVLMEDSLWKLVQAIGISRDAVGLVKQNYGIVAVLNTLALCLALPGGLVSPTVTSLISNGSAILASVNGMRPLLRG